MPPLFCSAHVVGKAFLGNDKVAVDGCNDRVFNDVVLLDFSMLKCAKVLILLCCCSGRISPIAIRFRMIAGCHTKRLTKAGTKVGARATAGGLLRRKWTSFCRSADFAHSFSPYLKCLFSLRFYCLTCVYIRYIMYHKELMV